MDLSLLENMFQIVDKNTVHNSSGFIVKLALASGLTGIHEIQYIDGNEVITVEIESGENTRREFILIIYSKTLKNRTSSVDISAEKKNQIMKNISDGLAFLGIKHLIE